MADTLCSRVAGMKQLTFVPTHDKLKNDFRCYANYKTRVLA